LGDINRGMASQLRKLVIINTSDAGGGAEHVSLAVLEGFLSLGLDAWLLVGNKTGHHPRVVSFHSSPFFDYRPYQNAPLMAQAARRRRADTAHGFEDFNHPYTHVIEALTGSPPDFVLCHNLHGGYFDLRVLPGLSRRMPVALRLFDAWLQTGHCAYPLGCGRWRDGCGQCPDLTIPPAITRDATAANLRRKQFIFSRSRLFVSAESQWMLDRARHSVLAPGVVDWRHIPGGVDLEIFTPGSRDEARRQLGLEPEAELLLYVAAHGTKNRYKDFTTVRHALAQLAALTPERRIVMLVLGAAMPDETIGTNLLLRQIGPVFSRRELAAYYRAADLLVHAAFEETYGNVVAEALACGTPVIAASGGGVVELIEHEHTGLVLPPGQPAALAGALAQLLAAPERRQRMGIAAMASRSRFDGQESIRGLHGWCVESHAAWHMQTLR
jgi:glycosyltransferase involved in cell wall biosynthesis